MNKSSDSKNFRYKLLEWYHLNKRELPWRNTTNPYLIWVSEIILQQTQIVQGLDYYIRFTEKFPTANDLANAELDEVLKLWQGLGYYSRARNMHTTAQLIRDNFNGAFPNTHKEIISLKGIGDYTAAAICSFSFNLPFATVDGNVYRFLARFFGIDTAIDTTQGKKEFAELAQMLLNPDLPGEHNQAMMEMGAIQCTPKSPNCDTCPFSNGCWALQHSRIEDLPYKAGKTKQRNRYFYYIFIQENNHTYIRQRQKGDVWEGLYDFPLIETSELKQLVQITTSDELESIIENQSIDYLDFSSPIKHVLSHQNIYAQLITVNIKKQLNSQDYLRIPLSDFENYPISRLVEKLFENK